MHWQVARGRGCSLVVLAMLLLTPPVPGGVSPWGQTPDRPTRPDTPSIPVADALPAENPLRGLTPVPFEAEPPAFDSSAFLRPRAAGGVASRPWGDAEATDAVAAAPHGAAVPLPPAVWTGAGTIAAVAIVLGIAKHRRHEPRAQRFRTSVAADPMRRGRVR